MIFNTKKLNKQEIKIKKKKKISQKKLVKILISFTYHIKNEL